MRKQLLKNIIAYALICGLLSVIWVIGYYQGSIGFNQINRLDSCSVDNDKLFESYAGFYNYDDEYYCVWTKGRSYKKINLTENHEICHHLVNNDYQHFCQGENAQIINSGE